MVETPHHPYEGMMDQIQAVWNALTYEQKEAATAIVFECIRDAISAQPSFRGLIYDIMGFGLESYTPLYLSGGMDITNYICEHSDCTPKEMGP